MSPFLTVIHHIAITYRCRSRGGLCTSYRMDQLPGMRPLVQGRPQQSRCNNHVVATALKSYQDYRVESFVGRAQTTPDFV